MKIIDFHSHFYTSRDDGAKKYLLEQGLVLPGPEGELRALKENMKKCGISISVNAPIAWEAAQVAEMNRKSIEYNKENSNVICLGAMHPGFDKADEEIIFLAKNGIKGIKMHPQEQGFYPDEPRMYRIYKTCAEAGLFVLLHAGAGGEPDFDREKVMGTPQRLAAAIGKHPETTFVLAHMGGLQMWGDAEKYLAGKKVYVDTAFCLPMQDDTLKKLVRSFGTDRVLFGTDFPWQDVNSVVKKAGEAIEVPDDKDKVFYSNAAELLGISNK